MTALEALREKKFKGEPLTAIEQLILDAHYTDSTNPFTEQAANEYAHMLERIKEHLPK